MHPDLSTHLHTPECNKLIEELQMCHKNHPFRKLFGFCNAIDTQMLKCLKAERIDRRQKNFEKSRERKQRIWSEIQKEEPSDQK